jgi:hypothetical protein
MFILVLFVFTTFVSTFASNKTIDVAHEITEQFSLFSAANNDSIDVESFEKIVESLFVGIVNGEAHDHEDERELFFSFQFLCLSSISQSTKSSN